MRTNLDAWPSLEDDMALAHNLFGHCRGSELVECWLDGETARVSDLDFARQFCDRVGLSGTTANDYLQRIIGTPHGDLLGGIRFYGGDVSRPFVEIIAHSFDDLHRLRECVRDEWSTFTPTFLRLSIRPGLFISSDVVLDLSIYVARPREMEMPPSAPSVRLIPFTDAETAIGMVARRYEHLAAADPGLARNVSPATADDLRRWHADGQLWAVTVRDGPVGVLAVAPGHIRWIDGDEINEEVIGAEHTGCGYAALAQAAWATQVARDRDRLLVGTIDGLNTASRKTAERAGRYRVLDQVFVPLRTS